MALTNEALGRELGTVYKLLENESHVIEFMKHKVDEIQGLFKNETKENVLLKEKLDDMQKVLGNISNDKDMFGNQIDSLHKQYEKESQNLRCLKDILQESFDNITDENAKLKDENAKLKGEIVLEQKRYENENRDVKRLKDELDNKSAQTDDFAKKTDHSELVNPPHF